MKFDIEYWISLTYSIVFKSWLGSALVRSVTSAQHNQSTKLASNDGAPNLHLVGPVSNWNDDAAS